MGGVSVDGREGAYIKTVAEMFGRFSGEVFPRMAEWEQRLKDSPQDLEAIEFEVQHAFMRGASLVVAGLISVVMQTPELASAAEQTRRSCSTPLAAGRNRTMAIRLLGGVMMWITSLYCEPRRGVFRRPDDQASGMHIEQAQFGFGKKVSPGLETQVSRQAALCPSFELAQTELERGGVKLDVKAVRRVAQQCGEKLLKLRTVDLEKWRAQALESTGELAGKRVTVQIDGGRTKLRGDLKKASPRQETLGEDGLVISDAPGRSKPRAKRTFDAEWREPKLMTIFIHNDKGRMEQKSQATIDGTFTGPDAMAELVAMHLHRLGAAAAESVTFVGDGAVWIWDRIEAIVKQAGLPDDVKVHQVLDNCHAVHHISLALASLGVSVEDRMPLYRELRSRLRNGQWKSVVNELQQFADDDPANAALKTELNYLRKHGEAGRLNYTQFRRLGLPLGSGAIESSIRRVINLRLKGNGIFWREEHAEEMLQLRALVISDRWNTQIRRMRTLSRTRHLVDWHWTPQPMSRPTEAQTTPQQNTA
jgi:hypothetical protein